MKTDREKESFLISVMKRYYPQGDSYYAYKNKKNKWHFGYSNDYPLQHGAGENIIIPDKLIDVILEFKGQEVTDEEIGQWAQTVDIIEELNNPLIKNEDDLSPFEWLVFGAKAMRDNKIKPE